ncbi:hypothetical protein ATANTOWER_018763 [Ataeniobius toweri]|uniref:Uncharacterized protein n=1 Tax=Ataeniobius toweri TaxID=208326 RepID=A0ABU7CC01_9TELE|nr:hypothetical protein [Ataeniobius toweri]
MRLEKLHNGSLFFGAQTTEGDMNAENDINLNDRLRIRIRVVFPRDPILVMERKGDDKGTGGAENPDGGDAVEGRSSADSGETGDFKCRALKDYWLRITADLMLIGWSGGTRRSHWMKLEVRVSLSD